jgi:hypothetical protein
MLSYYSLYVCYAKPLVNLVLRKPTQLKYLRINLFKSYVKQYAICKLLLYYRKTQFCRCSCLLEGLVLRNLTVKEDRRIYSTERERSYLVCIEVLY